MWNWLILLQCVTIFFFLQKQHTHTQMKRKSEPKRRRLCCACITHSIIIGVHRRQSYSLQITLCICISIIIRIRIHILQFGCIFFGTFYLFKLQTKQPKVGCDVKRISNFFPFSIFIFDRFMRFFAYFHLKFGLVLAFGCRCFPKHKISQIN